MRALRMCRGFWSVPNYLETCVCVCERESNCNEHPGRARAHSKSKPRDVAAAAAADRTLPHRRLPFVRVRAAHKFVTR